LKIEGAISTALNSLRSERYRHTHPHTRTYVMTHARTSGDYIVCPILDNKISYVLLNTVWRQIQHETPWMTSRGHSMPRILGSLNKKLSYCC